MCGFRDTGKGPLSYKQPRACLPLCLGTAFVSLVPGRIDGRQSLGVHTSDAGLPWSRTLRGVLSHLSHTKPPSLGHETAVNRHRAAWGPGFVSISETSPLPGAVECRATLTADESTELAELVVSMEA